MGAFPIKQGEIYRRKRKRVKQALQKVYNPIQMSENAKILFSKITGMYGTIRRARGCFLYTSKNVRLTDLYQAGGRAILGWGSGGAVSVLKNVLERKLTGIFDTDFSPMYGAESSRLSKAVSELLGGFDDRRVFVFNSCGQWGNPAEFAEKEFGIKCVRFVPWNQDSADWREELAVLVEPPFAWDEECFVIALDRSAGFDWEKLSSRAYRIPSPLCAAYTRAIYDLIRALQERSEKDWFRYDAVLSKYWTRKGPYLIPAVPAESYRDFMLHCAECGLVVSPDYEVPSIVPFGADRGNFSKLKNNPFEW